MRRIIDVLFITIFMSIIFIVATYILFIKDQQPVSYIENRNLFTNLSLADKNLDQISFQSKFEHVLEDQFIYRYDIVTVKKNFNYLMSNFLIPISYGDNILNSMGDANKLKRLGTSNYIIKSPMIYEERIESRVIRRVDQYNMISVNMPDVQFYLYHPTQVHETSLFDEANEIKSYGTTLEQLIQNKVKIPYDYFEINTVDEYKNYFYASDHHWNHMGSYVGYLDILNLLKVEDKPIQPIKVDCGFQYYGSFSTQTGFVLDPGQFCWYDFGISNIHIQRDGKSLGYFDYTKEFYNLSTQFNLWSYLYGIAYPYGGSINKYSSNINDESLLIIGDSYMPPILPLISQHFGEVFAVNPMDYYLNNGYKKFDVYKFIEENEIQDVLFMLTIENYFLDDEYGPRYEIYDVVER